MKKLVTAVMVIALFAGVAMAQSPSANSGKEKVVKQTLFKNVKVFNGIDDKLIAQDVLVEGNLIMKMGKGLKTGKGAIVIDGGGHVLMPGIIEAHNHLSLPISPAEIFLEIVMTQIQIWDRKKASGIKNTVLSPMDLMKSLGQYGSHFALALSR